MKKRKPASPPPAPWEVVYLDQKERERRRVFPTEKKARAFYRSLWKWAPTWQRIREVRPKRREKPGRRRARKRRQ